VAALGQARVQHSIYPRRRARTAGDSGSKVVCVLCKRRVGIRYVAIISLSSLHVKAHVHLPALSLSSLTASSKSMPLLTDIMCDFRVRSEQCSVLDTRNAPCFHPMHLVHSPFQPFTSIPLSPLDSRQNRGNSLQKTISYEMA
jgi:hypothetical protein